MAIGRVLRGEILDDLAVDDPRAQRSRRDLRLINALMGNGAWIRASLAMARPFKISEVGAGEGLLCRDVARWAAGAEVVGIDRIQRPEGLTANIGWDQGDLFEKLPASGADTVLGVMILHHLTDESLQKLGEILKDTRALYFCEPWRSALSHFWAGWLWPFVGEVTRNDMPASIDAGFLPGELPVLLGLRKENWRVEETVDWRGSLRLRAWRE